MPSHVRAVAKNDELSLRQFVLEKNVSPVRLPKQDMFKGSTNLVNEPGVIGMQLTKVAPSPGPSLQNQGPVAQL